MARYDYVFTTERDRIKRKRLNFIAIFLVVLLGFTIFYFVSQRRNISVNSVKLYFFDQNKVELIPIERSIDFRGEVERVVKIIIENLSSPPENSQLRSFIPAFTRVKSVSISGDLCTIVFYPEVISTEINSIVKESAAVYSIVNTITELPDIGKVKIEIEGNKSNFFKRYIDITKPLTKLSGQLPKGKKTLIYFYDPESGYYIGEFKEIPAVDIVNIQAESVLNQLIIGSDFKKLITLIPAGTKLLGVNVESGIAYIDFSKELRRISLGAEGEFDLVNLITLSLTELPNIDRIRFLVEGKEVYTISGHLFVNEPVKRWIDAKSKNDAIVYYTYKIEQNTLFVPVFRKTEKENDVKEFLNILFSGVNADERDFGLTSDIPQTIKLNSAEGRTNNELLIDVQLNLNSFLSALQEENFIRQIVLTVTENTTFNSVRIYFNGSNLESLPFGTDVSKSYTRNSL